MAEINIKKKKKRPIWPWILGILVALVVIWIIVDTLNGERATSQRTERLTTESESVQADPQEEQQNASVDNFSSHVARNADVNEMGPDHEYTANGIILLSQALNEIVNEVGADVKIQQKSDELKEKAEAIQKDPQSTEHANTLRDAFTTSADLMNDLQNNHFQDLDNLVSNVRETAEAIDPNTETLNQRENVKAFFASANQAVQEMDARVQNGQENQTGQVQDGQPRQEQPMNN